MVKSAGVWSGAEAFVCSNMATPPADRDSGPPNTRLALGGPRR